MSPLSLFQQASSYENLSQAWQKVFKNAGCAGGDGVSIEAFSQYAHESLMTLSHRLLSGSYMPSSLRKIEIKKSNGTIRLLNVPSVIDRIVQTSFAQSLTNILEPEFENCSHGYRQGKSVQSAIAQIEFLRNEGFSYIIEADIEDYFNNISHEILLKMLRHYVDDASMVAVINLWLDGFSQQGFGLPQGSPLSPLLANLYLDALDEEFTQKNIRIIRFADDFVILCKTEKMAGELLQELSEFLKEYGLSLNLDKTKITDFQKGFEFLGHLFVRSMVLQSREDEILQSTNDTNIIPYLDTEIQEIPQKDESEELQSDYFKHRALYVLSDDLFLDAKKNSFILHNQSENKIILTIPSNMPIRIEVGKYADISTNAIREAFIHNIPVDFMDNHQVIGTAYVHNEAIAKVSSVHLAQANHILDLDKKFTLAKIIVSGKIHNQRIVLKRLNRHKKNEIIEGVCASLKETLKILDTIKGGEISLLLGYEGQTTKQYYHAISHLINDPAWNFTGRGDKTNPTHAGSVIINILSHFLAKDMKAILSYSSLHAGFGFLHSVKNVPNALVYDLIEEFRPLLVESLMVYLMNNRNISVSDFILSETGRIQPIIGIYRELALQYEKRVNRHITINDTEVISWRGLMQKQIFLLEKHFTDETPYHPYRAEF